MTAVTTVPVVAPSNEIAWDSAVRQSLQGAPARGGFGPIVAELIHALVADW